MPTLSDWISVGVALFLGGIALIAPYVNFRRKRKYLAPSLDLIFDQTPPMFRLSSRRLSGNRKVPFYDFHFYVKTEGRSQAKKVEAILEKLWEYNVAGEPSEVEGFFPVNLRYDSLGTRFVDINPKRRILWNLGYILSTAEHPWIPEEALISQSPARKKDDLRFYLDVLDFPFRQPNCFYSNKHAIKISLYSENADRVEAYFEITWSGTWREAEKGMLREIRVKRVPLIK